MRGRVARLLQRTLGYNIDCKCPLGAEVRMKTPNEIHFQAKLPKWYPELNVIVTRNSNKQCTVHPRLVAGVH